MSIEIPSYEELFGDLDYSTGDEYRSVLSPAAYLVDIMNLKDWKWGDDKDAVDDRREDIANILLNAENTITEIPFLDIANDVMENKVRNLENSDIPESVDPYVVLGEAVYPFNLPFDADHSEFRRISGYTNMAPHELYRAYTNAPDAPIIAREYLGLSSGDISMIFTGDTSSTLNAKWGLSSTDDFSLFTDDGGVETFRTLAELSFLELRELLFQDLSEDEIEAGVSRDFFINSDSGDYANVFLKLYSESVIDEDTAVETTNHYLRLYQYSYNETTQTSSTMEYQPVEGETAVIPASYMDRIHRFIRLSRKTGLSFTELDLVLRSACGGVLNNEAILNLAFVIYMKETYELAVTDICALFAPLKDYGDGRNPEKANPFYLAFDRNYDTSILELDPETADVTELRNRIKAALDFSDTELDTLILMINTLIGSPDFLNDQEYLYDDLSLLYRVSLIVKFLDISVDDLLNLVTVASSNSSMNIDLFERLFCLQESFGNLMMAWAAGTTDATQVIDIVQSLEAVVQWVNETGISTEQLLFLSTDQQIETVDGVLSDEELQDLMLDLNEQFAKCLITTSSFESSSIDSTVSTAINAGLVTAGLLSAEGIVLREAVNGEIETMLGTVITGLDSVMDIRTITQDELTEAGITIPDFAAFISLMAAYGSEGSVSTEWIMNADGLSYFSVSANRSSFTPYGDADLDGSIFDFCADIATAYTAALSALTEKLTPQAESIAIKINSSASKQASTLYKITANTFGVRTAVMAQLLKKVLGIADESDYSTVRGFLAPVMTICTSYEANGVFDLSSMADDLKNLQRLTLLVALTGLKSNEIATAMAELSPGPVSLNQIRRLQLFRALCRAFNKKGRSMLDYLETGVFSAAELARVTEWSESEIDYLASNTDSNNILAITALDDVQCIYGIYEAVKLSSKFRSTTEKIKENLWGNLYSTTVSIAEANISLMEMLKAYAGSGERDNICAEIHNKCNIDKRDALIAYLVFMMEVTDYGTIENARDLYEYLLLDVEMGESATASRVQEAMMCMQLFYHRFRLNLETLVQNNELDDVYEARVSSLKAKIEDWWPWMKNYRVWEANRKVFLYPENYIRPELRDTRSDAFRELEEVLLQGEITDETVEEAYLAYLDKFADTSRLIIAGGYLYQLYNVKDESYDKRLILFGRTRTKPQTYYYMTGDIYTATKTTTDDEGNEIEVEVDQISWSPWIELGITLNSDRVFPVYAFNRIFVFWFEIIEKNASELSGAGTKEKIRYEPVFYYSFLNLNGKWTVPQEMSSLADEIDDLVRNGDSNQSLFILDKSKENYEKYLVNDDEDDSTTISLTTKQMLENAVLDITNPQAYSSYNAEECINITFEVGRGVDSTDEITHIQSSDGDIILYQYEGKLTNDLVFTECSIDSDTKDRLEPDAELPMERLGIYPEAYKHWKGFFKNTFNAPSFSFEKKGGSFLCKPAVIPDTPVIRDYTDYDEYEESSGTTIDRDDEKYNGDISNDAGSLVHAMVSNDPPIPMPDESFGEKTSYEESNNSYELVHLFFDETEEGSNDPYYRYAYIDTDGNFAFSDPMAQSERWGKRNAFYDFNEDIVSTVTTSGGIYLFTASHYIYAPFDVEEDETTGLIAGFNNTVLLDGASSPVTVLDGDFLSGCTRAFIFGGNVYLVNGTSCYTEPKSTFPATLTTLLGSSDITSVDSICIQKHPLVDEYTLLVSSADDLLVHDLLTASSRVSTLTDELDPLFADGMELWRGAASPILSAMTTDSDGKLLLFYNRAFVKLEYASENQPKPVTARWGDLGNIIPTEGNNYRYIESILTDSEGNVFIFMTNTVDEIDVIQYMRHLRMSDEAREAYFYDNSTPFITAFENTDGSEYFWETLSDLSADSTAIKELFSVNSLNEDDDNNVSGQSIVIDSISAATGFDLDDRYYLLSKIVCTTTLTKWRYRWVKLKRKHWWSKRKKYRVKDYYTETYTQEKDCYIRLSITDDTLSIDADYPKLLKGNWTNTPGDFNIWITSALKFWEDTDTTDSTNFKEVLYLFRKESTTSENGFDKYVRYRGSRNFPHELSEVEYNLIRLTSNTSDMLNMEIFMNGIDGMLSLDTQMQKEIPYLYDLNDNDNITNENIIKYYDTTGGELAYEADGETVIRASVNPQYLDIPGTITYNTAEYSYINRDNVLNEDYVRYFDYTSINGQYYWEIFYHAPFLIAQALNNAQNFDEARRWYEFIFDPTQEESSEIVSCWQFMPFQWELNSSDGDTVLDMSLYHALSYRTQLETYMDDPFDPHAIAALRQIAYRKAIVMNYIDNLIDWGDLLFSQYTREYINEARMLYVLAYDILGGKPENLGELEHSEAKSYNTLYTSLDNASFRNQLLILENGSYSTDSSTQTTINDSIANLYFYIPENQDFIRYWDRVEDRLFKIRNSLNIDGVKQSLALFEPPIDPMALVRAVSGGGSLSQAISEALLGSHNAVIPHYRFQFMLSKAKELTQRVISLGQSYLSALEKKDAEELAQLRNTQEKEILEMTLEIKEAQLEESEESLKALQASLKNAETRYSHYEELINKGLSSYEEKHISLTKQSSLLSTISKLYGMVSSATYCAPQGGSPFAITYGGKQYGDSINSLSQAYGALADHMGLKANLASISGGHKRREEDWEFQKNLAKCDMEQFERQINGAKIRRVMAALDIQQVRRQIKNNESVTTFMTEKFTNRELYQWMSSKLAGIYFQTYQMALDLARGAQRSLQFELGLDGDEVSYITPYYWDSLKKGLLAGERLQLDLDRMDKGFMEKNHRRFEISKSISLADLDPEAFLELRENRICEFTLQERIFDYDFPGHYCRQIKSVSISFPAVTGPYENINATLTQLSNRTLIKPDKAGLVFLLEMPENQAEPSSIKVDCRSMQQIALSRGVNDAGLFQLNFQDERYLPFEGTGAFSTWRLEFNGYTGGFDLSTLNDVIIKVEYTALQGGEAFANVVKKNLKAVDAAELISIARTFPAEWNAFMADPSSGVSFTVTRDMLPQMKGGDVAGVLIAGDYTEEGAEVLADTVISFLEEDGTTEVEIPAGIDSTSGTTFVLMPDADVEYFTPDNVRDIALVLIYQRKVVF